MFRSLGSPAPSPAPADLREAITSEIYSRFSGGTSDPVIAFQAVAIAEYHADAALSWSPGRKAKADRCRAWCPSAERCER